MLVTCVTRRAPPNSSVQWGRAAHTAVARCNGMALAAREVQIATGDDHAIAIERKVIVDPKSGLTAQVENVAVAVQLEDGTVGVARQQRIHFVQRGGTSTNECSIMSASYSSSYSTSYSNSFLAFHQQAVLSDLVVWAK